MSTPGEDRISYKLLKLLQNTRLGTQVFEYLADFLVMGRRQDVDYTLGGMTGGEAGRQTTEDDGQQRATEERG